MARVKTAIITRKKEQKDIMEQSTTDSEWLNNKL